MFVTIDHVVYEITPTQGGVLFRQVGSDREAFSPWSRVLDDTFPVDPGEHAERILEGSLNVREYLAGDEGNPRRARRIA